MTQVAFPDSKLAKDMSLKRTKKSGLIKNVINKSIVWKNTKILSNKLLSILIDESTDISKTKSLHMHFSWIHK